MPRGEAERACTAQPEKEARVASEPLRGPQCGA